MDSQVPKTPTKYVPAYSLRQQLEEEKTVAKVLRDTMIIMTQLTTGKHYEEVSPTVDKLIRLTRRDYKKKNAPVDTIKEEENDTD